MTEKWWEALFAGILAMIVLPAVTFMLLIMVTDQERPDIPDVTIVEDGKICDWWTVPYGSGSKPRVKCYAR